MRFHEVRTYLPRIALALLVAGTLSAPSLPALAAPAAIKHLVAAERADDLIARFRATREPGAAQAGVFNRTIFDVLLAQPGAAQLRVYHAKYADGRPTFVLYAADESGQDFDETPGNRVLPKDGDEDPQGPESPGFASTLAASDHLVTREHAEAIIERFASTAPATAVRSHTFDRSLIDALLAQPQAAGLRINHGTRADGTEALVLYAIDANGRVLAGLVGTSDVVR